MKNNQNIIQLLNRLWQHINLVRRKHFLLLIVLILFTSFAEVLSIGTILPFLAVLTSPEKVFEYGAAKPIIYIFRLTEPSQLLLPFTIIFVLAALIAGAMRILLLWINTHLSYGVGADLSTSIYRRTLYQPYEVHCARNSSEIINGILNKTNGTINIITMLITLTSSTIMLLMIMSTLILIQPVTALSAFGGFGLIYIIIASLTQKQLLINGERISRESNHVIKSLQEGLGGIRDVLISGSQTIYCQIYNNADLPLRRAQGSNVFIINSPRYLMEALGITLIVTLSYLLVKQANGIDKAIPILGALALGAQRLLPLLQQAYGSWTGILSNKASLQDTLELLDQPLPEYFDKLGNKPLAFKHAITLKQIGFKYKLQAPYVLKYVNLNIAKGSRVGFIGPTGTGKSTLIDIIMGLLQPTEGFLEVDGQIITSNNNRAWQSHIAHVPQSIFLSDNSIEENIAFGVPKDQINSQRVRDVAKQAQISDDIESWAKQYETFVGERGVRLSGGQRQRIGIARALYKQADVIIFDEATSALDNQTEQAVMESIESLNKNITLLIIAHRVSTLKNCTQIVELKKNGIKRTGTFEEIVASL